MPSRKSSKKSKKRRQQKAKRRARRSAGTDAPKERDFLDRLVRKFKDRIGLDKFEVIRNAPGQVKMSAVLGRFIAPYAPMADSDEAYERLVSLAVVAWNAALMDEAKRTQFLAEMVKVAEDPREREDMRSVLTDLIEHKERHFAENRRMIVDYQITVTPTQYQLAVVSTLADEPDKP